MKCRMYGISLVVLVSVLAAWVLRTHVPMTTARKGPGNSAINGDATAAQPRMTNRSHLAALGRASETQLLKTYGKLPLGFEANQGQTDSQVQFLARGGGDNLFLTSAAAALSLQGKQASTRGESKFAEGLQARHSLAGTAGKLGEPSL